MANDVKVLKLIRGEEVLTRIEQKDTMFVLEEPMVLQSNINQQTGQITHMLVPWLMSGKGKKISISIDHVIAHDDLKDQAEKDYLSTISGLIL